MASRSLKILRRVLVILLAVFVGLLVILQIAANAPFVRRTVDRLASEKIDADLDYSNLHFSFFKAFPKIRVSLEDLSLTYPHSRYAAYDSCAVKSRLLAAGRGEEADTLLRFKSFSAAVNPWHLLGGRIRLSDMQLDGLGVFAHSYGDAANWNIFRPSASVLDASLSGGEGGSNGSDSDADTLSQEPSTFSLPWISFGKVSLGGRPRIVYTDQVDTLFASVRLDDFSVSGAVKLGKVLKLRDLNLAFDTLRVRGRLPADTLAFNLDSLGLDQHSDRFNLGLNARALMRSRAFGRQRIPATLHSEFVFNQNEERTLLDLLSFDLNVAKIPFSAAGSAAVYADSTVVDLKAGIEELHLQPLLRDYLDKFIAQAQELDTDAIFRLGIEAKGVLDDERIPEVGVEVSLPASRLAYKPLELDGSVAFDCKAHASPEKYVKVNMKALRIDIPGLFAGLSARADDLLGADPLFAVKGSVDADLESLMRYLPDSLGISAYGKLGAELDGKARASQLKEYTADLVADMRSDTVSVNMGDQISLAAKNLSLKLENSSKTIAANSDFHPLEGRIGIGAVRVSMDSLRAGVRNSVNTLSIEKAEYRGKSTPKLAFASDNGRVFLRYGRNRAFAKDVHLEAGMIRRQRSSSFRRARLDSLQRVYPGVSRDSLFFIAMQNAKSRREAAQFNQEKSWAAQDVHIAVDSSITKFLRQWKPSGRVTLQRAMIATPQLPLRNSITALDAGFDDNEIRLTELGIVSGTSDLKATGSVGSIRRAMRGRAPFKADLNIESSRLNLNELLAAFEAGKVLNVEDLDDDDDERYAASFATDTLQDAQVSTGDLGLIVVPANVDAKFDMSVGKVDWSTLDISSFKADAVMKERCLQLTNSELVTDAGRVTLDAFYSTKSKQDISAGFNLNLYDISANKIINMAPAVDDMLPALKSFRGNLDLMLTATSQLDTNMNLIIPTLDGVVRISGKDLCVDDAGELRKITRLLMFKNKNIGQIEDMCVNGFVHDGRIEVFPFIVGVDRYKLALCGMQGFDRQLNYHVSILKSPLPIRFGINMFGTLDKWRFSLGRAKYRDGKVPVFTAQIDTMQVNIVKSIKQIYRKGVKAALEENGRMTGSVERYKSSIGYRTPDGEEQLLSTAEYCQIDSVQFAMEVAELDKELMAEVDQILDETFVSAEALRKQFDEIFFDKKLLRKQERAARRDARAAARAQRRQARS